MTLAFLCRPAGAAVAIGLAASLALPSSAAAVEGAATLNPSISALIADLEAGHRDAAIGRINSIETLSGRSRQITTASQLVDRLKGCKLASRTDRTRGTFILENTEWTCADGTYEVMLSAEAGKPYVTVAEFSDPARIAEVKAAPKMVVRPPAVPPPVALRSSDLSPSQKLLQDEMVRREQEAQAKLLSDFAQAAKSGSFASMADAFKPDARFVYGWRDPFNKTNITDLDGNGIAAGDAQLAAAKNAFGEPVAVNCKHSGMIDVCDWQFKKQGMSLIAFPATYNGKITSVQFLYATKDTIAQAMKNATPEQVAAFQQSMANGS